MKLALREARRLAVMAQRLAGPRPSPGPDGLMEIARALRCIQVDSVTAAGAPAQHFALWSRIGPYPQRLLDELLFEHRLLFHYIAPASSLVLTED